MIPDPKGKVYSASELIEYWGQRVNTRRCGRCGAFRLHAIVYDKASNALLLCERCDVDPEERAA